MTSFGEPLACDELLVVRGLTEHGTYMSPRAVEGCTRIARSIAPGNRRNLFVRRISGYLRSGKLLNEDAICRRLEARGFWVIEPGSMSLDEQISAFKGAERVVGISGAAMTNIAFCEPGTQITLLAPADFPDVFFWFIAQHRGLVYRELRGPTIEVAGKEKWAGDFSITEDDIAWLEAAGVPSASSAPPFIRTRIAVEASSPEAPYLAVGRLVAD